MDPAQGAGERHEVGVEAQAKEDVGAGEGLGEGLVVGCGDDFQVFTREGGPDGVNETGLWVKSNDDLVAHRYIPQAEMGSGERVTG